MLERYRIGHASEDYHARARDSAGSSMPARAPRNLHTFLTRRRSSPFGRGLADVAVIEALAHAVEALVVLVHDELVGERRTLLAD